MISRWLDTSAKGKSSAWKVQTLLTLEKAVPLISYFSVRVWVALFLQKQQIIRKLIGNRS